MNWGIYIGRFQPFHNGHLNMVKAGLRQVDRVLLMIGEKPLDESLTTKNPFDIYEVTNMIIEAFDPADAWKIKVGNIVDTESEARWVHDLYTEVEDLIGPAVESAILLGDPFEKVSYYFKYLPWQPLFKFPPNHEDFHATAIRKLLFDPPKDDAVLAGWRDYMSRQYDWETIGKMVPPATLKFLKEYVLSAEYQQVLESSK